MLDISLGQSFDNALISIVIQYFILGFIPGFYFAYLVIRSRAKKTKYYFILLYLLGGIIGGFAGWLFLYVVASLFLRTSFVNYTLNNPQYLIIVELVVIGIHFFYFKKNKKKT